MGLKKIILKEIVCLCPVIAVIVFKSVIYIFQGSMLLPEAEEEEEEFSKRGYENVQVDLFEEVKDTQMQESDEHRELTGNNGVLDFTIAYCLVYSVNNLYN